MRTSLRNLTIFSLSLSTLAYGAACGDSQLTTPAPEPGPASITVSVDSVFFDALSDSTMITAQVIDQNGDPLDVPVRWASDNRAVATVTERGVARSVGNGNARLTASADTVRANVEVRVVQTASQASVTGGDMQIAPTESQLPDTVVVRATDRLGNPVADAPVTLEIVSGGGSASAIVPETDRQGTAFATWTLGPDVGVQQLRARIGDATVTIDATGILLRISSFSSDTLGTGDTVSIRGDGFSLDPSANLVLIGGETATVLNAGATNLDVVVPNESCRPRSLAAVSVTVNGVTSVERLVSFNPRSFVDIPVGQLFVLDDPSVFCLQFAAGDSAREYAIGLSLPAEQAAQTQQFALTTRLGGDSLVVRGVTPGPPASRRGSAGSIAPASEPADFEDGRHYDPLPYLTPAAISRARALDSRAPGRVLQPGDTITIRVPQTGCDVWTDVPSTVRVVGQRAVMVAANNLPANGALVDADYQDISDRLDTEIWPVLDAYFGAPSDVDSNGRILIAFTTEVNKRGFGTTGFVRFGNLLSRTDCAYSNEAEVYYSFAPDPGNTAGTRARSRDEVIAGLPRSLAHELTHVIQLSRRVVVSGDPNFVINRRWELEGQAVFAEEMAGHAMFGNSPGQDLSGSVVLDSASLFYTLPFGRLAGWFGSDYFSGGAASGAPELCTLFEVVANPSPPIPCSPPQYYYGASWSLMRYIADQFGPTYPGGEQGLHRDWISANPQLGGVPNVEALLGVPFDDVFVRWSASLWADGRVDPLAPELQFPSWDLADVMSKLGALSADGGDMTLKPTVLTWGDSDGDVRNIRGGSTAYHVLSSSGQADPLSVRVGGPDQSPLTDIGRPRLWVVRSR